MAGIVFNRQQGGLGRQQPGNDYISGLIFQNSTALLAGAVQKVSTLAEAEALGVTVATYPVENYHISEFFAIAQNINGLAQGTLYFMIKAITPAGYDGTEIEDIQNFAAGDIRQAGVFLTDPFLAGMVTDSQTAATTLEAEDRPLSVIVAADFTALTISALADIRLLDSKNVSVCIGEDADGVGGALATSEGYSITCLGASLGSVAQAAVHENIGWRGKFDVTHGTEYEVLNFATGEALADQSKATITALTEDGYLFLVKETGVNGSFHNDSPTTTLVTSDYAYIENNRTIDKAVRLVRENLIPKINSPLYANPSTGKLSEATISDFRNDAFKALENMAANAEISTNEDGSLPENSVIIDPDQDVLTTSTITLTVQIVPVGVARTITVNIGFAVQIT
jgi:hypothetical protein